MDAREVMCMVTTKLYKGGSQRPDVYFTSCAHLGHQKYHRTFNKDQQKVIEESGPRLAYDIEEAAQQSGFDISLHFLLQQYTCGLAQPNTRRWHEEGTLENKLYKIKELRNEVSHYSKTIDEEELEERIDQLANQLEFILLEINDFFMDYRGKKVIERLRGRLSQPKELNSLVRWKMTESVRGWSREERQPKKQNSPEECLENLDLGKAGLAVGAVATAGLVGYAAYKIFQETNPPRRKNSNIRSVHCDNQTEQKGEECVIM